MNTLEKYQPRAEDISWAHFGGWQGEEIYHTQKVSQMEKVVAKAVWLCVSLTALGLVVHYYLLPLFAGLHETLNSVIPN